MRLKFRVSGLVLATLCYSSLLPVWAGEQASVPTEVPVAVSTNAETNTTSTASPVPADNSTGTDTAASATPSPTTEVPATIATTPETTANAPTPTENDGIDALAPVKEKLVSPEQQKMTTELKPKFERFTLLNSDNPEDYKRKRGIWISDSGNGRIIYMRDFDGNDFYSLGNAGHDIGQFLNPEQVWVDIEGKLYIADRDNNRIVRVDDVRGFNWTEKTGFSSPRGVAMHGKRFIVSDTGNNRVLIYNGFDEKDPMVTLKDERLNEPGYLWLDDEGNIFVACGSYPPGGRIVRIPYDLTVSPSEWTVYEGQGLSGNSFAPAQAIMAEDGLYTVDTATQRIVRMRDIKGRNIWEMGSYGNGVGEFIDPMGMSQDEEGNIYVIDSHNDRLIKMKNIRGQEWKVYDTANPTFGLRSPRSVYVWSPRPTLEEIEDRENADKDKQNGKKDHKSKDNAPEDEPNKKANFVTSPDGNGSGFAL